MTRDEFQTFYSRLLLRSWTNSEFAQELDSNPVVALSAVGLEVPENAEVEVVRETSGKPSLSTQFDWWVEGERSGRYRIVVPDIPPVSPKVVEDLSGLHAFPESGCATTSCYTPPANCGGNIKVCTTCTPCCCA
jgi:hypothetical protein